MNMEAIESLCQALEEHLNRHRTLVEHLSRENKEMKVGGDKSQFPDDHRRPDRSSAELGPIRGKADADELFLHSMLRVQAAQAIENHTVSYLTAFKKAAEALELPFSPPPLLTGLAALAPQPFRDRLRKGSVELARLKNIIFRDHELSSHYIEEALRLVMANLSALSCSVDRVERSDLKG